MRSKALKTNFVGSSIDIQLLERLTVIFDSYGEPRVIFCGAYNAITHKLRKTAENARRRFIKFGFHIGKQVPDKVTNLFPNQEIFPDEFTVAIFGNLGEMFT